MFALSCTLSVKMIDMNNEKFMTVRTAAIANTTYSAVSLEPLGIYRMIIVHILKNVSNFGYFPFQTPVLYGANVAAYN